MCVCVCACVCVCVSEHVSNIIFLLISSVEIIFQYIPREKIILWSISIVNIIFNAFLS